MKQYSATEIAILDYLYSRIDFLPLTVGSPEVEWIYTTPHGKVFGLTNGLAQSITIVADRCGEYLCGGTLQYVRGRKFDKHDHFQF